MKIVKILSVLLAVLVVCFAARYILYEVLFPLQYKDIIDEYSSEYDIDAYLMMAMINTESDFDKEAVSPVGAKGLMQLTESTAKWIAEIVGDTDFVVDDLYDPETNIKMGSWYINYLKEKFDTTELVLAAYNAGPGNVNQWLNDSTISKDGKDYSNIPFEETRDYVKKILREEKIYQFLY